METEEFIARKNVKLYRHHLEHDAQNGAYHDGQRHAMLLKLLVEAEDKLGHSREQLNDVDKQISTIKSIINKQLDAIAMLKTNGHPIEHAERVLARAIDFLSVHEEQRKMIAAALDPGDTRSRRLNRAVSAGCHQARAIVMACHCPPRAVATPLAFRASAMSRSVAALDWLQDRRIIILGLLF